MSIHYTHIRGNDPYFRTRPYACIRRLGNRFLPAKNWPIRSNQSFLQKFNQLKLFVFSQVDAMLGLPLLAWRPVHYALFLHEAKVLDPERVASGIEAVSSLTRADAPILAQRGHGVLIDGLSHDDARAAQAGLADHEVAAEVVEQSWLMLPYPLVCRKVVCTPQALRVYDFYGGATEVPWQRLAVLATGFFPESRRVKVEDAKVLAGQGRYTVKVIEAKYKFRDTDRLVLDLVLRGPSERIRIISDEFDYSYLGSRRVQSSPDNFKNLVADLARHAPHAMPNRGTRTLLKEGASIVRYPNSIRFERETCWHLWRYCGPGRALDSAGSPYRTRATLPGQEDTVDEYTPPDDKRHGPRPRVRTSAVDTDATNEIEDECSGGKTAVANIDGRRVAPGALQDPDAPLTDRELEIHALGLSLSALAGVVAGIVTGIASGSTPAAFLAMMAIAFVTYGALSAKK